MPYLTSDLLAGVKRRAQLPDANGALSDADLLALGDLALRTVLTPHMRSVREEYGVFVDDQTITADQADYPVPWRAEVAGGLRDVRYMVDNGDEVSLPFLTISDADFFVKSRNPWWHTPFGWTLRDTTIQLLPVPTTTTGTLRVYYYKRHGRLISTDNAGVIDSMGPGADEVTLASSIASFGADSGPVSLTLDVVDPDPHFDIVCSKAATVDGTSVTFTSTIDSGIAVGDYVTQQDEAAVIRLPVELHPVLETATLMHVFESLGDMAAMQTAQSILAAQLRATRLLLEPRTDGEAKVVTNLYGPLRKARRSYRG